MKNFIKNLVAVFIIIPIIWGAGGIELFRHICLSNDFDKVSILIKPSCNHNSGNNIEESCCKIDEALVIESSCCENEISLNSNELISISSSENCCKSFSELRKIEDLIFSSGEKKVISGNNFFIISFETELTKNNPQLKFYFKNNNLPISVFGRKLLNLIHQLKIDTPTC